MSLKKILIISYSVILIGITILGILSILLDQAKQQLNQKQKQRYRSYLLAAQLRQSSDDLTRMARTYVIMGDPKYEKMYWDIIAIRNGEKTRPQHYERIYWDLVLNYENKPRPDGEAISLQEMMKQAGFTPEEFAKLQEAQNQSDDLVTTETIAMNAIKGLYDDGQGNYIKKSEPDFEMARRIMHDEQYHRHKAAIMRPIDEFFKLLNERTQTEVKYYENSINLLILIIQIVLIFLTILVIAVGLFATKRILAQVGGEPSQIAQMADQIANGQFNIPFESTKTTTGIYAALQKMVVNLKSMSIEREEQSWLETGQTQLSERVSGNQSIKQLAENIINFLTPYVKAQVGAFYILEPQEEQQPRLRMIASHAYLWRKSATNTFDLGEGLVGQAGFEQKHFIITQPPPDYIRIQSGLGKAVPNTILVTPFLYEEELKGVIELASFNSFNEVQLKFIEQAMPSIGITVNMAESRTQMQALLQQTQLQADQLQQQQDKLQQSNQELRIQQEQLEAQTVELEERTHELEQQKAEMEQKNIALEQTQHTLTLKAQELEQAIQYKSEFLANTSHELRTPLNGIIGLAESLIDGVAGELSEKAKDNLAMIVGSGKRLATLVNDILDFSKLQHQDIELQLKPIGLWEMTEIVLTLSQPLAFNKSLQLTNRVSKELPPVLADENRLQQILYNLIGNAIKFTDQGTVEVSAQSINQHLELTVSDTGIGIPKEKLEQIFESFEQGEGSTAREYGGTGLGLAVTKQLVELHGGQISVESTVGQGSQFIFTLPKAKGQQQNSRLSTERLSLSKVQAPPSVKDPPPVTEVTRLETKESYEEQLNILIVDDEQVNLQVLNNYLSLQNYHIIQANSGLQALAFIEGGFKPDAILLDVMMPKMTGYEVTRQLREKWQADEMPIILLTAKNQVADLVTGLESGANDYLTKPISKDELLARLKTHIHLKELKEETLQLALENERMKTELEVTRRIQQMILPKENELDNLPYLEIAGFMAPADEVGGDYYDVLQYDNHLLIGIGDVTGHGLESGMLMLMVQAGIRTLWENQEADWVKFFNSLNRMIYKNTQQRMGLDKDLTLSLLEYQSTEEGGILSVSGCHEEVLVVRDGQLEQIDTSELGFPVGLVEDLAKFVNQSKISLAVGDVVVLFTDGITEAENLQKEQYGIQRLCDVIVQNESCPVKEIKQAIIDDVRQYIGEQKVFDDMTLVILRQK